MRPAPAARDRTDPRRVLRSAALSFGAALLGVGALMDWAVVGFPPQLDPTHTLDVPYRGTDLWEGVLALAVGVATLIASLVLPAARATRIRRALAGAVVVLGLATAAIAASDAVRARDRFDASGELEPRVREAARALLRVDLRPGLFLVITGGVVAAAGGGLALSAGPSTVPAPEVPDGD